MRGMANHVREEVMVAQIHSRCPTGLGMVVLKTTACCACTDDGAFRPTDQPLKDCRLEEAERLPPPFQTTVAPRPAARRVTGRTCAR